MRQTLSRLTVLVAALVVVLLIALLVYVRTDHFGHWAREKAISYVESRFPVELSIGSFEVSLFQGSVSIRDLSLSERDSTAEEPAISAGSIILDFSLIRLFLPAVRLDRLVIDGLRLRLIRGDDDRLNLARMFESQQPDEEPRTGGFSPVRVAISEIELKDVGVVYEDQLILFDSESSGFDASLAFDRESREYSGSVALAGLALVVDNFDVPLRELDTRFTLAENRLELTAGHAAAPGIDLTFEGSIHDLRTVAYAFQIDVAARLSELDWPEVAQLFEAPGAEASFTGRIEGVKGEFDLNGSVNSELLTVTGIPIRSLEGGVHLDRQGVRLEQAGFRLFNGRGSLTSQVAWSSDATSSAEVRVIGVELSRLLRHFETSFDLVESTQNVSMTLSWPGLRFEEIEGSGRLDYRGRLIAESGDPLLPVSGQASFRLRQKELDITEGSIATEEAGGAFRGSVDFDGSVSLEGRLAWPGAGEPSQLLINWDLIPPEVESRFSPRPEGSLEVVFQLQRTPQIPLVLTADFDLESVTLQNQPYGRLKGSVRYDEERLEFSDLQLAGNNTRAWASAQFSAEPVAFQTLEVRVETQLTLLAELGLIDPGLEPSGDLRAEFDLRVDESGALIGKGEALVSGAEIAGFPIARVAGPFALSEEGLSAGPISAQLADGELEGSLKYRLADEYFEVAVRGSNLNLEAIPQAADSMDASGRFDVQLSGSGTLDRPIIEAEVRSGLLQLAGQEIHDVAIRARPTNGRTEFSVEFGYLDHRHQAQGWAGLAEPYPFEVDLELDELPLDPLIAHFLTDSPLPEASGVVSGNLTLEGEGSDWQEFRGEAEFQQFEVSLPGFAIRISEPLRLTYREGILRIPSGKFAGPGTDLTLSGTLGLGEGQDVNLSAEGTVDLSLFEAFLEGGELRGSLTLETRVSGPLSNPRIVGTANLEGGTVNHPELPVHILSADGDLRFTASQLSIEEVTVRTQYGAVTLSGGVFLDGVIPVRWQVNAYGYGLSFPYPEDVTNLVDVDLDLVRADDTHLITGVVYVRSAEYTRNLTIAELIYNFVAASNSWSVTPGDLDNVSLDLTVEAHQSLRIDNNLAEVVGSGEVSVIGTLANPVVVGSLTIDQGRLSLEGNSYEITRGTVSFNNPRRTTPYLNFEAETEVREYTIEVMIRGPVDQIQMNFRSDPPLSTASIVSLLAAGQTEEEIFGSEYSTQTDSQTLATFGAGTLLSKTLGEAFESQTTRLFGFERFSIDPFVLDGASRDPAARITLGKQITREFGITYISSLGNSYQDQTIVVQYKLTDWLTAVGTAEQGKSAVAIDFKLRKRF